MNQARIGTDIIEISRIRQALERWGAHFQDRVFTPAEIALCSGRVESLAARFAAKEAVMKALSVTGFGFSWREIEVLAGENGEPSLYLHGSALKKAQELGLPGLEISLSHSRELAVAFVLGLKAD